MPVLVVTGLYLLSLPCVIGSNACNVGRVFATCIADTATTIGSVTFSG